MNLKHRIKKPSPSLSQGLVLWCLHTLHCCWRPSSQTGADLPGHKVLLRNFISSTNKLMSHYKWDRKVNREYLAQRGVHRDHTPLWLHVASPLSHWEVDPRSCLRPVSGATCPSDVCSLLSTFATIRAAVPTRIPQGHSRMPSAGRPLLPERCPGLAVAVCRRLPLLFPFYFSFSSWLWSLQNWAMLTHLSAASANGFTIHRPWVRWNRGPLPSFWLRLSAITGLSSRASCSAHP